MGKTIAKYIEQYGGPTLGFLAFYSCTHFIEVSYTSYKELIKQFPSIGMFAFGFLLTIMSIIIQSDHGIIKWLRSREVIYIEVVKFNKRVVTLSLILTLYTYVLGNYNFSQAIQSLVIFKYLTPLYISFLIWFIFDIYIFLKVFYLLIIQNSSNGNTAT